MTTFVVHERKANINTFPDTRSNKPPTLTQQGLFQLWRFVKTRYRQRHRVPTWYWRAGNRGSEVLIKALRILIITQMNSDAYQQSRMRNRSGSAAGHRRAFWARSEKVLRIWHANPRQKTKTDLAATSPDYFENFSYDPAHMAPWTAPRGLLERQPAGLVEITRDWQKSCAAVLTALERAEAFSRKAAQSAYPQDGPRRNADQPVPDTEEPVASPFDSPIMKLPPPMGMESPPYTPIDSFNPTTPWPTESTPHPNPMNLHRIPLELSPLSPPSDKYPFRESDPGFNQIFWEHFREQLAELINDCGVALQRVRGYGRRIGVLLVEQREVLTPEVKLGVMEYDRWWSGVGPRVEGLGARVEMLEVPRLNEVTAMARAGALC
ncbi:hypothetical protein LTR53_006205 [Teratosphaeriaceae sp. CCFEE 6253]|nr:hypothetical protein LTR53_006205 [Teratosphaeriaceae sp. CCFEE 6253]